MRPQSIKMFDYLLLGSLALGVVSFVFSFGDTMEVLRSDPAVAQTGLGAGFAIGIFAFSTGITLLLWFLISRMRSKIAKWILIAFTVLGIIMLPGSLAQMPSVAMIASVVITVMQVAAIYFLFRPDAKDWLDRKEVDSTTFE